MSNQNRAAVKLRALEYKGSRCLLCGYDRCKRALIFHHIDPEGKDFEIGEGRTRSWEALVKELDKCVLLCSNCHMEVHDGISTLVT